MKKLSECVGIITLFSMAIFVFGQVLTIVLTGSFIPPLETRAFVLILSAFVALSLVPILAFVLLTKEKAKIPRGVLASVVFFVAFLAEAATIIYAICK